MLEIFSEIFAGELLPCLVFDAEQILWDLGGMQMRQDWPYIKGG